MSRRESFATNTVGGTNRAWLPQGTKQKRENAVGKHTTS